MRKIKQGKVYDTETAEHVGFWKSGNDSEAPEFWKESLYRKKTGEYFLHGEGGPASKYAKQVGQNKWEGGSDNIPLPYEAAERWAKDKLGEEQYNALFGPIQSDNKMRPLNVSISGTAYNTAWREAVKKGIGLGNYIEYLIVKEVEEDDS